MQDNVHSDRILYQQPSLPIFQNRMYDTYESALASPVGEMKLVQDARTGLVRNAAFDPSRIVYDTSYQNEQGLSSAFQTHLNQVADLITINMGREELVEVGCGKGLFLEMLSQSGVDVTGFDPAYEGSDPKIRQEYFNRDSGLHARGLVLRHVLEHIPDPVSFLKELKAANGGRGLIYIEVPCFEWICANRAWFDVFYEHVNYFRLSDFFRMFAEVKVAGHLFGGQYLYAIADLSSIRDPVWDESDIARLPDSFAPAPGLFQKDVTVWGGASKGVIFSLISMRAGFPVARVIDINPAKQGKYLPITGIKVQGPEEALKDVPSGSKIYIMNRNYLDEIMNLTEQRYEYVLVDRFENPQPD